MFDSLPRSYEEGKLILELEKVIDKHSLSLQNRIIMEYIIEWKNMPQKEDKREDGNFMKKYHQLQDLRENIV